MPPGTLRRGERDVTQWVLERAWQSAGTTDDNRASEGNWKVSEKIELNTTTPQVVADLR
jgi:hypothetical protein